MIKPILNGNKKKNKKGETALLFSVKFATIETGFLFEIVNVSYEKTVLVVQFVDGSDIMDIMELFKAEDLACHIDGGAGKIHFYFYTIEKFEIKCERI